MKNEKSYIQNQLETIQFERDSINAEKDLLQQEKESFFTEKKRKDSDVGKQVDAVKIELIEAQEEILRLKA